MMWVCRVVEGGREGRTDRGESGKHVQDMRQIEEAKKRGNRYLHGFKKWVLLWKVKRGKRFYPVGRGEEGGGRGEATC